MNDEKRALFTGITVAILAELIILAALTIGWKVFA